MNELDTRLDNLYKIGQVSRMAGVRVETLRAWDKRDQLVADTRIGSIRYYTKEQVRRATFIQQLIKSGLGYTIGALVPKSDEELERLANETLAKPAVQARATVDHLNSTDINIVVGWQLHTMRQEYLRQPGSDLHSEHEILDTGLYTIEQLEEFLRGVDGQAIGVAVIYLPHVWQVDSTFDVLRNLFDLYEQPDCQIIAVSPNSLMANLESEQRIASKKGVKLISSFKEGHPLKWTDILEEIEEAHRLQSSTTRPQSADFAQLCYLLSAENRTIAGIQTADFVRCIEQLQNLTGGVNRECQSVTGSLDSMNKDLLSSLNKAAEELEPWLLELAQRTTINK